MSSASRRLLVDVQVTDAEKRRHPSKHYVYVIQVTWDDGSKTVIFRRYSVFFDFQIGLLECFPHEGGIKDPAARVIPFLPGKILFRRSHVRDVAMKRLKAIDEYCKALLQLPPGISKSEQVLNFFESKPEDLRPNEDVSKGRKRDEQVKHKSVRRTKSLDIGEISGPMILEQYRAVADYKKTQPKELTLLSGQILEVIEKHENGWWFVNNEEGERGWVPGVYLEKQDGSTEDLITKQSRPGEGEKYITIAQYNGGKDEVSFGLGVLVEVLQKNLEGWWFVSYQGTEGWAPASYLEKPADAVLRQTNKVEIIPSIKALHNRRSLPSETINAIAPPKTSSAVNTPTSSPKIRIQHLKLGKTNSDVPLGHLASASQAKPNPLRPVPPPPKRSSVKRKGSFAQKPIVPPPLPPIPSASSEPVYEYVTTCAFDADIPHGISFKEENKVKVLEKSPGDWWYIELNGEEGWAPASHIRKEFKQSKPDFPPSRPKPPKMVEVARNKESNDKWEKSPNAKNLSPSTEETDVATNKFSSRPSFPLKPAVILSTSVSNDIQHKETTTQETTAGEHQSSSNIEQNITRSTPNVTRPNNNRVTESLEDTAKFDFKNALKNAVSNKLREGESTTTRVTPSSFSKPSVESRKLPVNGESNRPKTTVSGSSDFPKKQFSNQPPSAASPSKPALPKKSISTTIKTSNELASKEPTQVDFRSVLKARSKQPTSNKVPPTKNETATKKPPLLPVKPRPAPKTTKILKNESAKASPPEPPSVKSKPTTKPVLRRFQVNNNNSNTVTPKNVDVPVLVVGKVETPQIVPNASLACTLRGSPDGQVDKPKVDEKFIVEQDLCCDVGKGAKHGNDIYVAIADFIPENENEVGFSQGAEGLLKKKSDNDWWYMEINGRYGWVPCNFFEPKLLMKDIINHSVDLNNMLDHNSQKFENDPVYSEIDADSPLPSDLLEQQDLYEAGAGFGATDGTMVDMTPGDILDVLSKTTTGWWYVKVVSSSRCEKGEEGWVPSEYLDKI